MKLVRKRILAVILSLAMILPTLIVTAPDVVYAADGVTITKDGGWLEAAYAEWSPVSGATGYKAYVKKAGEADSAYVQLDNELIREYKDGHWRADAVGLAAGNYVLKIEALLDGTSVTAETASLTVLPHDRSGFAWINGTSSGAYSENGTLKSGAKVIYVTEANKDTVKATIQTSSKGQTTDCTGILEILTALKKGEEPNPVVIRIIGDVKDPAEIDTNKNYKGDLCIDTGAKGGTTIEGIGEDATADGWGIRLKNASNVEIRNLAFINCNSDEGDDVGLQQNNDHVWVHNCDFFYGHAGSDKDQVKGDGALDTKTSTYVTHSYNHFWDTGKSNLQGMDDEKTTNYITYHHNWYDHSDSRHPRIRTCTVHIYNNYYDGNAKYGVGVTMGSSAFVEGNYFRNCKYPMLISMQGSDIGSGDGGSNKGTFSSEDGGVIKAYNNYIEGAQKFVTYQENNTDFDAYVVNSASETVPSSVKAKQGGTTYNNFDTNASLMYSYTADSPEAAKNKVVQYAGRMNGGDLKWTFNNSVDDESYAVNQPLKDATMNYTTQLKAVGGIEGVTTPSTPTTPPDPNPPGGGDNTGGSTGENVPAGDKVYNVTIHGKEYDGYFKVKANEKSNATQKEYNGMIFTKAIKMESGTKTSISFTTTHEGAVLTIVLDEATAKIKVDDKDYTAVDGIVTVPLSSTGSHTVAKADSVNLYYMQVTGDGETSGSGGDNTVGITGITIDRTTASLKMNETIVLSASVTPADTTLSKAVNWSSSDTKVATVSDGKVVAVGEGTATITAVSAGDGSFSAFCVVTVTGNSGGNTSVEKPTEKPAEGETKYTGMAYGEFGWRYYRNGLIDWRYTGMACNEYGWWYYRNGLLDWNYTGMACNEYGWWYYRDGRLDWNYTGMACNEYGWWYYRDGQLDWNYTGMACNEYGWWYYRDGRLDWNYTGMACNEYGWWYYRDGRLDWNYTGMAENEYGWWYYRNGQLDWNYTGYASNEYGQWHFTNGFIDGI